MHRAFLNVGYLLSENQLQTHFAKFGRISDVYLPKHTSGRNKGFGFVTFDSAEALEGALLTPVHVINGVIVQAKRAGVRPPETEKDLPSLSESSVGLSKQQPFGRGPRLYVGGVADAISAEMVWRHFARWGTVADVYFPGKRGHKRVNYCFVTFEDWSCAQRACDQSERTVHGWPLDSISLAGARKQEAQLHLAPDSIPSSTAQPHDQLTAAQMASLAGSPGYTLWLRQQLDQLQASMSAQASATFVPLHSAQADSLTRFKPRHQDLMSSAAEQQQYIYMQGVQDGMRSNSLPAAVVESSDTYATSPLDGYAARNSAIGASGVHGISHPPALFPPSSAGAASTAGRRPAFLPGQSMSDSQLTQLLTQSSWQHPHGSQPAPHFIPAGLEQQQQQQQLERSWHAHQATSIDEYGVHSAEAQQQEAFPPSANHQAYYS